MYNVEASLDELQLGSGKLSNSILGELETLRLGKPDQIALRINCEELLAVIRDDTTQITLISGVHVFRPAKILLGGILKLEKCLHSILPSNCPEIGICGFFLVFQDPGPENNE